jgi:RNA 3'-terminal phosphate cyclase (ATP)
MTKTAKRYSGTLEIDGSQGEGGGQILRTVLALSVVTGKSVRLENIRAHRPQPGLKPQHLKAVEAAAAVSNAEVAGATLGSLALTFQPGRVRSGNYRFDIGTAGATSLVLQTVLLPLSIAPAGSSVLITGGTHVPWSPSFHYLAWHWLHFLHRLGFSAELVMQRAGFYPPGGGRIRAEIRPVTGLKPLSLTSRGELVRIHGVSGVANLDLSVAERQRARAMSRLVRFADVTNIDLEQVEANSRGTYLVLLAEFDHTQYCYCALGERGKRAESVADEAVDSFERFLATKAAVDAYLADQLVLPLALCHGESRLYVAAITRHLLTNIDTVRRFLPVTVTIDGREGQPGQVYIARED